MDKLLTRRWRLRKKLQYEEADLVRDELEAMGVSVFDKGAMWHGPGFASCANPNPNPNPNPIPNPNPDPNPNPSLSRRTRTTWRRCRSRAATMTG